MYGQQRHRQDLQGAETRTGSMPEGAECGFQDGNGVGLDELTEARDDRRLLNFQKRLWRSKLLILDYLD